MMMILRPILSDSHPKKMKNGVPRINEYAIIRLADVASTFAMLVRKNSA